MTKITGNSVLSINIVEVNMSYTYMAIYMAVCSYNYKLCDYWNFTLSCSNSFLTINDNTMLKYYILNVSKISLL